MPKKQLIPKPEFVLGGCPAGGVVFSPHMGGCQNWIPFLGTLNNRRRIIIMSHKWTLILTTTHMSILN